MFFTEDGEVCGSFKEETDFPSLSVYSNSISKKVKLEELNIQLPNEENIKLFRLLNQTALSIQYTNGFYQRVLNYKIEDETQDFHWTRLAFYGKALVGGICCLFEKIKSDENDKKIIEQRANLLTLATLPTFRKRGIATHLMHLLIKECRRTNHPPLTCIYLHVQTSNETALEFYKNFDFQIISEVKDYYRRIRPANAFLLELKLE